MFLNIHSLYLYGKVIDPFGEIQMELTKYVIQCLVQYAVTVKLNVAIYFRNKSIDFTESLKHNSSQFKYAAASIIEK